jgi:DNA (cytosine-5)-methyltransferase 1
LSDNSMEEPPKGPSSAAGGAPRTVASFFAGIGGFDLGFQRAGYRPVFQCEKDAFCMDVLARHWPDTARSYDILEITDATTVPAADVWCGGFPCQDVSLARARPRDGLAGKNSGLFYPFASLVGRALPSTVVLENVPGLLSSHRGRDFGIILSTLDSLGYGVAWRVLNSRFFGVPQSRQRLYIVGCLGDSTRSGEILFEPERSLGDTSSSKTARTPAISPFKESVGDPLRGPVVQRLGYCLAATSGRHTGTDWSRTYVSYPASVRRLTPREAERLQGFPDDWTVLRDDRGNDLDSRRYAALGNAVTVPVATWLAHRISRSLTGAAKPPVAGTADLEEAEAVLA